MGNVKAAIVVVTPFQQNCTLLWDEDSKIGIVVDPGGDVDQILAMIKEQDVKVDKIVLTHGHIDHAGGAERLKKELGVKIIGPHKADKDLLQGIEKQAEMFGVGADEFQNASPDQWLDEGDTVEAGGQIYEVLHCPGHAPGHIVLFNRANNFAHVGDVLFNGSIGRTDLPGGDHDQLIKSIKEKLFPLGDDVAFICGHGHGSTIGKERQSNPFLT